MKYFSTFTSGLEPIIGDLLRQSLHHVAIDLLLSGLVVYSTDSAPEKVKNQSYFTNSFLLLHFFPNGATPIEEMMATVSQERIKLAQRFLPNQRTFRVVTSKENQPVPVNQRLMVDVEQQITRSLGLQPNRSKPQVQFWFLTRSEGFGFFGMRITPHPDYAKVLGRGELRPEITDILCLLSEPNKNDVFLDPFAGSGAIVKARAHYPHTKIIAGDISPKDRNIKRLDATKLDMLDTESVDKIVTDPPWGLFDEKVDVETLYPKTLDSFYRVLKKNGTIVILVGNRDFFEKLLAKFSDKFNLTLKLYILVSGKKAGIYKLLRT